MYFQTTTKKSDVKFLGIKIHEIIEEQVELFNRPFKDDKEEQEVLAETACITKKVFGIPYIKVKGYDDPDNLLKFEYK